MPFFKTLVVMTALLAVGSTAPTLDKRLIAPRFNVRQIAKNPGFKTSPAYAIARTYLKYGKQVPAEIQQVAATQGSVIAVEIEHGLEYLCPVTFGDSQETTLAINPDTGSSDFWVMSSLQPKTQLKFHNSYVATPSKKVPGQTWNISYSDGSGAFGEVYTDTVTIAGITIKSQSFGAASFVTDDFVTDASDGILGLGFESINTCQPKACGHFLSNIKAQLARPVFTADLRKGADGSYDFGFIDRNKYTGSITYVEVDNRDGWWEFTADGYTIGDGKFVKTPINAIVDTGTTLWLLPEPIVEDFYATVPDAFFSKIHGGWIFPCTTKLPPMAVTLRGYKAVVPGSYINYGPISEHYCFGGIQPAGPMEAIFGGIFITAQIIVFDMSTVPMLGFAAKAGILAA